MEEILKLSKTYVQQTALDPENIRGHFYKTLFSLVFRSEKDRNIFS